MDIRVSDVTYDDLSNGPGLRTVVWAQGCLHNCKGCHNPETHNLSGGLCLDSNVITSLILKRPGQSGVTFSGGDPMEQSEICAEMARKLRMNGKNIWAYSGYLFEDIIEDESKLSFLREIDVLVDGKYNIHNKDITLPFRGSSNQRVIDVQTSLIQGEVVLISKYTNKDTICSEFKLAV